MMIDRVPNGLIIVGQVKLYKKVNGREVLYDHGTLANQELLVGDSCQINSRSRWTTTAVQSISVFSKYVVFTTLNSTYVLRGNE